MRHELDEHKVGEETKDHEGMGKFKMRVRVRVMTMTVLRIMVTS